MKMRRYNLIIESLKVARKQFLDTGKVPADIFKKFSEADPSPRKKYILWMCKQYVIDPSQAHHILNVVADFDSLVHRGKISKEESDIYKHTLSEVGRIIQKAEKKKTKGERKREQKAEVEKVFENDRILVVVPHTYEASKIYGANTKWCTTSEEDSEFWNSYYISQKARLYYIIDKKENKKYAVIMYPDGKREVRDELDNVIDYEDMKRRLGF